LPPRFTGYAVVVTKSTVPVGSNRKVAEVIAEGQPDADFDVASNPEFLREGAAIDDFMRPDRVVVGVESDRAAEVMADIYRPLYLRDFPIVTTRSRIRRDDQICRECVSGDQDHLHQ
jgi:UDPglucose 6-dehydrogenase